MSSENPPDYAVVWRAGEDPIASGRLQLGEDELVLHGGSAPEGLRIRFDELASVEIGRGQGERINGDKTLVLERRSGERVLVGVLSEFVDLLARGEEGRRAREPELHA